MSDPARDPWRDLTDELALWRAAGRIATLWWRDDDAAEPTAALDRLIGLTRYGAPLVLASVPGKATPAMAERLKGEALVEVVQHGWLHKNHAPEGEKASEFTAARPMEARITDLMAGHERLTALCGAQYMPVFVPPWNRIGADLAADLPRLGYGGLSLFGPRLSPSVVNTHVDPIAWKDGRRFRGEAHGLKQLIGHLSARRLGQVDASEPTGILTHHLDHDTGLWDWLDQLFRRVQGDPAVQWLNARQAFGLGPSIG